MKKRRYSAEFKSEAARLMIMEGLSAQEVSERLGVKRVLLYRWKEEQLAAMAPASASGTAANPAQLAAEIDELRKRLAKAERINEILKKTVSYFAKEE